MCTCTKWWEKKIRRVCTIFTIDVLIQATLNVNMKKAGGETALNVRSNLLEIGGWYNSPEIGYLTNFSPPQVEVSAFPYTLACPGSL
jgi:hypothetical protein